MADRPLSPSRFTRFDLVYAVAALLVAATIGAVVPISPTFAVTALIALIAIPAAVIMPRLIPHILIVTIFAEAVTIGGVTIGRLAAPLAFAAVVANAFTSRLRLRDARSTITLVSMYSLLALASLAWTVNFGQTLGNLASLAISVTYMSAFATLVRDARQLRSLMWTALVSSLVLGILWITQFASGVDRRFNQAGDPNFFAALQLIVLPLIVVLASSQRTPARKILLYVAIAIIADSVISTLSRGGFLALLLMIVLLIFLPARGLFASRREKVGFLTAAALGLAILLPLAWGPLAHRFTEGFKQTNVAGDRGDLWLAALHGYSLHPLTGLGYGGFEATSFELLRVTPGVNLAAHLRFREGGEFVHSAYIGSLAELGPVGLVLFVGLLLATGRSFRRTARRATAAGHTFLRTVANALLVGLVTFALSSALLSTETSRSLWFIVGMSIAVSTMVASPEPGSGTLAEGASATRASMESRTPA